jgi:hypothetical protein
MVLDIKTYWLTDRQSQCDFDFDFAMDIRLENGIGSSEAVEVQNSSRKRIGSSLRNWQLQEITRKELDCAKKTSCVYWSDSETDKSVARIRLVNCVNVCVNKPNHPIQNPLLLVTEPRTHDDIMYEILFVS